MDIEFMEDIAKGNVVYHKWKGPQELALGKGRS